MIDIFMRYVLLINCTKKGLQYNCAFSCFCAMSILFQSSFSFIPFSGFLLLYTILTVTHKGSWISSLYTNHQRKINGIPQKTNLWWHLHTRWSLWFLECSNRVGRGKHFVNETTIRPRAVNLLWNPTYNTRRHYSILHRRINSNNLGFIQPKQSIWTMTSTIS